jgi:phosphoglycolate phosphatase
MGTATSRNVLFDLDGTLTDPREGIVACIRHALAALGHSGSVEGLERFIGPPLRDAFRELLATDDAAVIESAIARYRERFREVGMYENRVYEGIPEALELLDSSGARLFVATSKPRVFAERILEHFCLASHFVSIHGCHLDGTFSEKAKLIAHILAHEHLSAADTLMVGDRHHDAAAAIGNRVIPVGVLWGYGTREELALAGVQRYLERPEEIGGLVPG